MSTVDQVLAYTCSSSEVIPVSVVTVRALIDFLYVDLYLEQQPNEPLILYRKRTHPVLKSDLDRLIKRGVQTLYVAARDRDEYRRAVDEGLSDERRLTPAWRYRILHDYSKVTLRDIFVGGPSVPLVSLAHTTAASLMSVLCREDLVVRDVLDMLDHDDGVYAHSLSVAACCLLLAQGWGITSPEDLTSIVVGALLHDLGKRYVFLRTSRHPGTLNSRQRKEILNHPIIGFRELIGRGDVTWAQLMIVYQHHERVDGTGYPVGTPREDIHEWARLCAVADAFCALTARTPYRRPMKVNEALDMLDREAGTSLDREMVHCWKAIATATRSSSNA